MISATTGNHGQSIAFAAARAGVPCTLVVPRGNNPGKNALMRAWGATVIEHGKDFDEARELVERLCGSAACATSTPPTSPISSAGVGTYALEMFETLADIDVVFVPVGGGSGACGLITVRDALGLKTRIVGVGAERADAVGAVVATGTRIVGTSADTFAEGIATRVTFDLTFGILQRGLDDFVLLSEEELADGVRLALALTHNLAEGAGGAAMAAAEKCERPDRRAARGCVMSGGNMDPARLRTILAA